MKDPQSFFTLNRLNTILLKGGLFFFVFIHFSICLGQVVNDVCEDAHDISHSAGGIFICVDGTTSGAHPDIVLNSPCAVNSFPTVWYKFVTDWDATHVNIHVYNDSLKTSVVRLFQANNGCESLIPKIIGPDGGYCHSGINGVLKLIGLEVNQTTSYFLALTSLDFQGNDFELCINSISQDTGCVKEKWIDFYNESSSYRPQGPFYPGDEVRVCMTLNSYSGSNNGCQWFQGLVPVFGDGWDPSSFDGWGQPYNASINSYPIGQQGNGLYSTATWDWFTDVGYHFSHDFYQVGDLDANGTIEMCSNLLDPNCPFLGGLFGGCCGPCWDDAGDVLPPGWFAYGIDGTCNIPGPPVAVDWGDGNSCGPSMGPWEFCFDLNVRRDQDCYPGSPSLDLSLGFFTFADGETGSWSGSAQVCAADPHEIIRLPAVCFEDYNGFDTLRILACNLDTVLIALLDYTSYDSSILYWHYEHNTISSFAMSSYMAPGDTIKFIANNPGSSLMVHHLIVYGHTGEQTVRSVLHFEILIYPEISAAFNYTIIGKQVRFNSHVTVDSLYHWTFGDGMTSNSRDPVHLYDIDGNYRVQLILKTPCGVDTVTHWIQILTAQPVSSFIFEPHRICAGDTIHYRSTSSGLIDSMKWVFEGGNPSVMNIQNADIQYNFSGIYDILLITVNELGADTLYKHDIAIVDSFPVGDFHIGVFDTLLVFTYTGTGADSVFWDFGEGVLITGEIASKIYDTPGKYPVVLIVKNACGRDTVKFQVDITPTFSTSPEKRSAFKIYPNPATRSIQIFYQGDFQKKEIEIFNLLGQRVCLKPWPESSDEMIINLNEFLTAGGTYLLRLKTERGYWLEKLVWLP